MLSFFIRSANRSWSDDDVLDKVKKELWREPLYREQNRYSLALDVQQAVVTLRGHVTGSMYRSQIAEWVQRVPAVIAVRNDLVADADLAIEVAQVLGRDVITEPYTIRVGAHLGWVNLAGEVPTADVQTAADAAAASVPQVRGVLGLPRVTGSGPTPSRPSIQPLRGQAVYGRDGLVGRVAQVVINPLNRLVSYIGVCLDIEFGRKTVRAPGLLVAEDLVRVNDGGVFVLKTNSELIAAPAFRPDDFLQPTPDWQPPFPYAAGDVWWPAQPLLSYRLPLGSLFVPANPIVKTALRPTSLQIG